MKENVSFPKRILKQEPVKEAAANSLNLKQYILQLENKLQELTLAEDLRRTHFELAKAYYEDQETEKAFEHFLVSLKNTEAGTPYAPEKEENESYEEALGCYLQTANDPISGACELLKKYGSVSESHPEWLLFNFLMSTAYANVSDYGTFFEKFYNAFPYLQTNYLAQKLQGILFLKLAMQTSDLEKKHTLHEEAFHFLNLALDKNPLDAGLCKVLIYLSKEENNESLILGYLQKILNYRVAIARGDIYLYVREAVAIDEYEIAQKIIDHASSLYDYSRAIEAAQNYLNQHRGT